MVVRLLGITGKKYCGKSTVSKFFCKNNIPIINIDTLYMDMFKPGNPIHKEIILYFKDNFLTIDGNIDFERLSFAVCEDQYIKIILDEIIEQEICVFMRNLLESFEKYGIDIAGIDSGNMLDTKVYDYLSQIIMVESNLECRIKRMSKNFNEQSIEKIISIEEQKNWDYYDFIITNNSDMIELENITNKTIEKVILAFKD